MKIDLTKFFTKQAIAATLGRLPELKSPVLDLIYPRRVNHPLPVLGAKELAKVTGNIPLVKRGTQSYALDTGGGTIRVIEPQSVNPSDFMSGKDINDFRMLDGQGKQQLIDNSIDSMRRTCRATAEAMAAQSITGKISYWLRGEGGATLPYTVDFGTPATVTVSKKWDAADATVKHVIKTLGDLSAKAKKQAPGSDIIFVCGMDVYAVLIDLAGKLNNSAIAQVDTDFIKFGGNLKVTLLDSTYTDLSNDSEATAIPEKTILCIVRDSGFTQYYCALDDLASNFVAMPFFAKAVESDDPSGVKIIGESKPMPVPNVLGIVKASVLT